MTRSRTFKRNVRARMGDTGESYTAARLQLLAKRPTRRVAVTNGESVAATLRQAGLADEVIAWSDALHDGPVPDLPPARLRRVRAGYLAQRYRRPRVELERDLTVRDAALRQHAAAPLSLWFEADVYDQLQLVQVLSRLASGSRDPSTLTLICIAEHPDRARFGGLGELSGEQLAGLGPLARPLSADGMRLASQAWAAFTSSDPSGMVALQGVISSDLRFLGDAVTRLLQEYPSASDGLSLTQRRILLAVRRGQGSLPAVLRAHWETEMRPFLGDLGCEAELRGLAYASVPALLESEGLYTLTRFGERLLAGAEDWVAANGVDHWIGGVHLEGRTVPWRYDERLESLVAGGLIGGRSSGRPGS